MQCSGWSVRFASHSEKPDIIAQSVGMLKLDFLRQLRPALLPPALTIRNLASGSERDLVLGYVAEQRGDPEMAIDYFRRVTGPTK